MATKRQVLACRRNGRLGGPKTAEGKAVARLNARKHGIFASALTDEDAEELEELYTELAACLGPVGVVEEMLVDKLAHTYLRLQRCARAEAECHVRVWEIKTDPMSVRLYEDRREDGRHASWFDVGRFERLVRLFGRYDQTLTNQFVKLLHEIERVQRLRDGEDVAPPVAADVNVSVEDAEATTGRPFDPPYGGLRAADGRNRTRGSASLQDGEPTAEGGCATQARETNQIDQKPLADKEIQRTAGAAPGDGTAVLEGPAPSGPQTNGTGRDGARPSTGASRLPHSFTWSQRAKRRGQVFFQKKAAPPTADGNRGQRGTADRRG